MAKDNTLNKLRIKVYHFITLLVSMAGFVPKNATIPRTIAMVFSLTFAGYLIIYQPDNSKLAITYFLFSEVFYISFLIFVLSKNGLRHWFIRVCGNEDKGYLTYEAILGFLFFHNLISIGYVASSSPDILFPLIHKDYLSIIALIMFISGFTVKISAANAVSIEIYYLKDMFLGKKISDFVVSGPYKYISNPMYGIGQLQAYATAIWYDSVYGLIVAILNQALIFTFYYLVEKKFIKRVYQKPV
jgi:protein-S-isoprenylcysteine O-methyltransferase Ste14